MNREVMIVDDDLHIRHAVEALFSDIGIGVLAAEGITECIEHLRKGFKGVVLMDIMMPGSDGWDTIREILNNDLYRDIFIVMLTAKDEPDSKMHGLQEYVTDYITKPFDPETLVKRVSDYLTLLG